MISHYFILAIFSFAGILSLGAATMDWDWFFTAQNSQWIVKKLGRNQARIFYGVLGIVLIVMAAYFFYASSKESM